MISLIFWQAFPKAHVPFELYRNKMGFFSARWYIKAKICRNLLIFLKIFKKIKSESFFCNQLQKMFTLRKTPLTYTVRNMYENFWLFSQSSRIRLFPLPSRTYQERGTRCRDEDWCWYGDQKPVCRMPAAPNKDLN